MKIRGSIVALITPFQPSGELDMAALHGLIDMHLAEGTDAIMCCGTTAEAPTLDEEEQVRIIRETVQRVAGRVPVIAGTGFNSTRKTKKMTQAAKACGVDACLVVIPYYNRPTFEGIEQHFAAIADVGLPIILYHHPARTGVRLTAEQLVEICKNPMIGAVKEASGEVDLALQFMHHSSKPLFSGDDTLTLPLMAAGAQGDISIVANVIPRLWHELTDACLSSDMKRARVLQACTLDLCKALVLETNPQGVKFALSLMGKCHGAMRLPLVMPREKTQHAIREAMQKMGFTLPQRECIPAEPCSV
jgi:4-hydroxy-tetrahydrodipicolinate synthase